MDTVVQGFSVYSPITHLNLAPTASVHQLHASMNGSSWHRPRMPAHTMSLTSGHSPSHFTASGRSPVQEYPSPAPSTSSPSYTHSQNTGQYATLSQAPLAHMNSPTETLLPQFSQIESSIGPTRVMTRQRVRQLEKTQERRASLSHYLQTQDQSQSSQNIPLYSSRSARLHSTNHEDAAHYQRDRISLNTDDALSSTTHSLQHPSPSYHPMTPASPSYSYPSYDNSRPNSGVTPLHQRASSPTHSCVSVATTVSSESASGPQSHTYMPYPRSASNKSAPAKPKQKKQRLDNDARKDICVYHSTHPHARQEDIATVFKVERSTISKILKQKSKWLNLPDNHAGHISKARVSKFPQIEEKLIIWVESISNEGTTITDGALKQHALNIGATMGLVPPKFKGSPGWIEKFKERHNIRAGVWHSRPKTSPAARLLHNSPPSQASPSMNGGHTVGSGASGLPSDNDDNIATEESPRSMGHAGLSVVEQRISASPTISTRTSWADHSNGISPSRPMTEPSLPVQHVVEDPSPFPHGQLHLHLPTHTQEPEPEHPISQDQYMHQAVYYNPDPPVPAPAPTIEEAQAAVATLVTFLDTREDLFQDGYILREERGAVGHITRALYQKINGVPYDREQA